MLEWSWHNDFPWFLCKNDSRRRSAPGPGAAAAAWPHRRPRRRGTARREDVCSGVGQTPGRIELDHGAEDRPEGRPGPRRSSRRLMSATDWAQRIAAAETTGVLEHAGRTF